MIHNPAKLAFFAIYKCSGVIEQTVAWLNLFVTKIVRLKMSLFVQKTQGRLVPAL
jgi:hypothetical protein